ncbi:MAG: hypothetical protein N2202_08910, partial [Proteobacteria bacterium]|nr:hypothetical protein [Pseudomonadota bacterium]
PLIEPNARIMTRFNISAWYAGGEYVNFPLVSWEEFVKNIDNYKADYILIGPAEMSGRTDISMNLLKSTQENKKFRLVKSARMQGSFEFYLVKVEK